MLGIKRQEFSTVNTEAQRNFSAHSDLPLEFKDPETFEIKSFRLVKMVKNYSTCRRDVVRKKATQFVQSISNEHLGEIIEY